MTRPDGIALPTVAQDTVPVLGLLQLLASVVLLSSAWPLTKIALAAGSTPLWFAEARAVLSGAVAFVLLAAMRRLRLPRRPDFPAMLAVGGLQLGAYFALAHEAVAWVPAGRTAILANTTTIWVVPLSLLFLREHIPARRWIATGLGLTGVAVLVNPVAIDWSSARILVGHAFLLGAALSWSIAIIVTRAARPAMSMLALLPWCFLVGSLVLAPVVWWHASTGTLGTQPVSWWALAYIGLIAGPVGTWCVMQATASLPALVASLGFLTTPAVSLILANVVLHEPFTPDLLAGSALIMSGVGIAAWPRRRHA
ncbi:DMT family transporter [Rhodopila sp.]|uniref:DMT family transporter n=1 Tax=Rhodopila sp. TaxID=2480087 RepID=UPI003D1322C2